MRAPHSTSTGPAVGQHHLGVRRAVRDAERVEHAVHVREHLVLLLAARVEQLLVVVDERRRRARRLLSRQHSETWWTPSQLIESVNSCVPRSSSCTSSCSLAPCSAFGRPIVAAKAARDRVGRLAQDDAVGAGAVERLDDDRPVAARRRPRDRLAGVAGLELLDRAHAGVAQRLRHQRACRAARRSARCRSRAGRAARTARRLTSTPGSEPTTTNAGVVSARPARRSPRGRPRGRRSRRSRSRLSARR